MSTNSGSMLHNIIEQKFSDYDDIIDDLKDQFKYIPGNDKALEVKADLVSHVLL